MSMVKNPASTARSVVKYVKLGTARAAIPRMTRRNPITKNTRICSLLFVPNHLFARNDGTCHHTGSRQGTASLQDPNHHDDQKHDQQQMDQIPDAGDGGHKRTQQPKQKKNNDDGFKQIPWHNEPPLVPDDIGSIAASLG